MYNFKPTKRFIKLVGEEVISVGFPQEQLKKYLSNVVIDASGKMCRALVQTGQDEKAFAEWEACTRIKEPRLKTHVELYVPEEWKPKTQVMREENLPVFKMVYDLLLRIVHESHKMGKDFRYTIGEDLKRLMVRMEVCIYHANEKKEANEKLAYIGEALEKMFEVKLYVRILRDSKQLPLKKYVLLVQDFAKPWTHSLPIFFVRTTTHGATSAIRPANCASK